jgi:hypothetical protein
VYIGFGQQPIINTFHMTLSLLFMIHRVPGSKAYFPVFWPVSLYAGVLPSVSDDPTVQDSIELRVIKQNGSLIPPQLCTRTIA